MCLLKFDTCLLCACCLLFAAVKTCVLQVNMGSSVRRDAHVKMEECVTMWLGSAHVLQGGWYAPLNISFNSSGGWSYQNCVFLLYINIISCTKSSGMNELSLRKTQQTEIWILQALPSQERNSLSCAAQMLEFGLTISNGDKKNNNNNINKTDNTVIHQRIPQLIKVLCSIYGLSSQGWRRLCNIKKTQMPTAHTHTHTDQARAEHGTQAVNF